LARAAVGEPLVALVGGRQGSARPAITGATFDIDGGQQLVDG